MSVRVMSLVWQDESLSATDKIVMLSLADHADDEGYCYPSIARLTRRTSLTERTVQTAIQRLKKSGNLEVKLNAGRGLANLYRVIPTPAADAPPQEMHPAADAPIPPHMTAQTPAADAPKPSVTIKEPSVSNNGRDVVRSTLEQWASPHAVASFIAYRRKKKGGTLTETAAIRQASQLEIIFQAGGDTDDALGMAEERGWTSVQADWYFNAKGQPNATRNHRTDAPRGGNRKDETLERIARLAGLGKA